MNARYVNNTHIEWTRWHIDFPEMTFQKVSALVHSSDLFRMIGNTGTAVDRRENTSHESLTANHQTPELKALVPSKKLYELVSLRHPDPSLTPTLKVEFPSLQIYGSWKK